MADLTAATEEAQQARIAAMKGKKVKITTQRSRVWRILHFVRSCISTRPISTQVLWLTCFYTWEVYGGLKPTLQAIMGHGVEAYVVFGDTDNDRYVPRMECVAIATQNIERMYGGLQENHIDSGCHAVICARRCEMMVC
jgi:hypothetical protein